jgi:hypothetical protein
MPIKQIIDLLVNLSVPECPPKENSEYHLGWNACRVAYAEEKLKAIRQLEKLLK